MLEHPDRQTTNRRPVAGREPGMAAKLRAAGLAAAGLAGLLRRAAGLAGLLGLNGTLRRRGRRRTKTRQLQQFSTAWAFDLPPPAGTSTLNCCPHGHL